MFSSQRDSNKVGLAIEYINKSITSWSRFTWERKTDKHKIRGCEKSGASITVGFLRECRHEGKGSGRFGKNKDEGRANRDNTTQHVQAISVRWV